MVAGSIRGSVAIAVCCMSAGMITGGRTAKSKFPATGGGEGEFTSIEGAI